MKCDKEKLIHWMNNQMTEKEREAFEIHLTQCETCQQELKTFKHISDLMEQMPVPEPAADIQARFQGMLDAYKQSLEEKSNVWQNFIGNLQQLWKEQPKLQIAYSIVLVLVGLAIGYFLNRQSLGSNNNQRLAELSMQVDDMRQMMLLSLVENPSASKRLQAVSYSEEISNVNNKVIEVLLTTLNEDPNVNVRLATLEALVKYSNEPRVREGLVQSISQQESPLVISAMADAMVRIHEKRSLKPLQQLLNREGLDVMVKSKIERSIYQLI